MSNCILSVDWVSCLLLEMNKIVYAEINPSGCDFRNLLPAVYDFSKPVYNSSKLGTAKNLCNLGLLAVKISDCVSSSLLLIDWFDFSTNILL